MTKRRRWRRKPRRSGPTMILLGLAAVMVYVGRGALFVTAHPITRSSTHLSRAESKVSRPNPKAAPVKTLPASFLIHVAPKDQYPQLPNGCEVTSLAMLMTFAGHPVSKMTLAREIPKDPTKLSLTSYINASGQTVHRVVYWGNPNE